MRKAGLFLYKLYVAIGAAAIALVTVGVMITVIMRYFFGITYSASEGLIAVTFAFSVFWGVGAATLENEHVGIDVVYQLMPKKIQHIFDVINTVIMVAVNFYLVKLSFTWIAALGETYSVAIQTVKMKYIYGVFPLGFFVGGICALVKLYLVIMKKYDKNVFKPALAEDDVIGQMERELSGN